MRWGDFRGLLAWGGAVVLCGCELGVLSCADCGVPLGLLQCCPGCYGALSMALDMLLCGLRCAARAFEMLSEVLWCAVEGFGHAAVRIAVCRGAFEMLSGVLWCAVDGFGHAVVRIVVCRGAFEMLSEVLWCALRDFGHAAVGKARGQRSLWAESTSAPPERSDGAPV